MSDPSGSLSFIERAMRAMEDDGDDGRRPERAISPGPGSHDLDRILDGLNDERMLDKLTRYWIDERSAPDILLWQGLVVEETLDKLQAQVRSESRTLGLFGFY
jgi:hypothetical protein